MRARTRSNKHFHARLCLTNSVLVVTRARPTDFTETAGSPWTRGGLCPQREQGRQHCRPTEGPCKDSAVVLDDASRARAFLGTWISTLVNHRSAEVLDVMTSTRHGSDKVLTNPAFTTLHRTKACMNLSPGVSPLGATGPGCLGIQAGGAHLHRKTPGIQTTWAGDLLYHRRTLWPWAFTLWVSGFPHL